MGNTCLLDGQSCKRKGCKGCTYYSKKQRKILIKTIKKSIRTKWQIIKKFEKKQKS